MKEGSLKKEAEELKKFLALNIRPDVMVRVLAGMEVIIPIDANPELIAEQLSPEIIARPMMPKS